MDEGRIEGDGRRIGTWREREREFRPGGKGCVLDKLAMGRNGRRIGWMGRVGRRIGTLGMS
jgi:hypothetical protein